MRKDRPSSTATLILRAIVFVAHDPILGELVPGEVRKESEAFLEHQLLRAHGYLRVVTKAWFRRLVWLIECVTLPGIFLHYVVRKRFIEDSVREGIKRGATQIVVLAAGFDTLVLRLHLEFPGVRFIELDHPATQRVKGELLRRRGSQENMVLLPMDFTKDRLEDTLSADSSYDRSAQTIFVAEGISMYMRQDKIERTLQFITTRSGRNTRVVFTFMDEQSSGRFYFKAESFLVRCWLRLHRESFTWGFPKREVDEFLGARSMSLVQLADHDTFRARYLTGVLCRQPLAEGECVCIADRS